MAGGPPGGLLQGVISWRNEGLGRLGLVTSTMPGRPVALSKSPGRHLEPPGSLGTLHKLAVLCEVRGRPDEAACVVDA